MPRKKFGPDAVWQQLKGLSQAERSQFFAYPPEWMKSDDAWLLIHGLQEPEFQRLLDELDREIFRPAYRRLAVFMGQAGFRVPREQELFKVAFDEHAEKAVRAALRQRSRKPSPKTLVKYKEMHHLHTENRWTLGRIAKKYGITESGVRYGLAVHEKELRQSD